MKYRAVHGSFWTDPKVKRLSPDQKLLFLYFITSPHSHLSGIYYVPLGLVTHETGLEPGDVKKCLLGLQQAEVARWDESSEVIWVVNMLRYQGSGAKTFKAVIDQLASLHDSPLVRAFADHYPEIQIPHRYPIDGASLQEQDQEQKQEMEVKLLPLPLRPVEAQDIPYAAIIDRLNEKAGTRYRPTAEHSRKPIRARWNEDFRLDDFHRVIDLKTAEWLGTEFAKYLRPATLFGPKFESYLNSAPPAPAPTGEAYNLYKEVEGEYEKR